MDKEKVLRSVNLIFGTINTVIFLWVILLLKDAISGPSNGFSDMGSGILFFFTALVAPSLALIFLVLGRTSGMKFKARTYVIITSLLIFILTAILIGAFFILWI